MGVVEQSVEDGRCEDLVAEDRAPLGDELVGGDEHAALLVAARDEPKEEMRAALLEGQVPELVEDEQLRLGLEAELLIQLTVGFGTRERAEQRRGALEEDAVARLDDRATKADREVRLSDAW